MARLTRYRITILTDAGRGVLEKEGVDEADAIAKIDLMFPFEILSIVPINY